MEAHQNEEWNSSVELLQSTLDDRIPILREALLSPECNEITHVVLEYDFRRRGLRIDCILIGNGIIFVVEFKRQKIQRADRDQVMTYAVNLIEFHKTTQELCEGNHGVIVVPVIALTAGILKNQSDWPGLGGNSWPAMASKPLECDRSTFCKTIGTGMSHRRTTTPISSSEWLNSSFRPSSSILDAALSLYGNHDVVAIQDHAAPKASIEAAVNEIRDTAREALARGSYHVIFLSGAPGAGKTLVGLDLVMRGDLASNSVFVTGNAPLVDVLNKALSNSFRSQGSRAESWAATGYRRSDARLVSAAANFKVVKAHNFLGKRGSAHSQEDGRLLVFDEAQRTYEKGRIVLGSALDDHEADLILEAQKAAFPSGGAVVLALVGHNQAINRGELGILAWLEAAERKNWSYSISDETLALAEFKAPETWAAHPLRHVLKNGHLHQSMRYYRNKHIEEWAGALLDNDRASAERLAIEMEREGSTVWITRSLEEAKRWARAHRAGNQRAGLIASGQAKRLAAEGLFVDLKPSIADWMLAPSTDVRSSNALETVQNQYQVQGLELDYTIVCWDADLRRNHDDWTAFKLSGSDWNQDRLKDVAKNSYRVLLTRARKGMVIFVPKGDPSGEDVTRKTEFYDGVFDFLSSCGAKELKHSS
ncbi:DUF2075 domain-containing protein [Luteolibacter flavescens]|uniref:DUF2075 domain-containing protein n=1 Tax=Luteolibacter flavescens TaxID=1859460 RepID=A0ABT3FP34_9BACT|nr:DUF2075 domain-containing protein [Luteolibacter flavescens]MCW1885104.1 DUF2075 domain-containing protein [Luteolibacter flavescens]